MRLFEKCVYQSEVADTVYNYIGDDQFAYKKGHNSTMDLIKYQHMWLKIGTRRVHVSAKKLDSHFVFS
jgi:hypothetical protein